MKKRFSRILAAVLVAAFTLAAVVPGITPEASAESATAHVPTFENTYQNTGIQRLDILGVAMTQVGYEEGENNDTKYGTWYGLPYNAWCAMFITWCARQAEISTEILGRSAVASPSSVYFNLPKLDGNEYTPLPGDLFFTRDYGHVGLVFLAEGEYFYTIEANSNLDQSSDGYWVLMNQRKISDYWFGSPEYEGDDMLLESGTLHDYVRGREQEHPHRYYYECTACGDKYYTGYTEYLTECSQCHSCDCSDEHAGYYLNAHEGLPLNVRSRHSTESEKVGGVPSGAVVYVLAADPEDGWAHIVYDGLYGLLPLRYLEAYVDAPQMPVISTEQTEYKIGSDVTITWSAVENNEVFRLRIIKNEEIIEDLDLGTQTACTLQSLEPGMYEVWLNATNLTGSSDTCVWNFRILDTFEIIYDANGGTDAPPVQLKKLDQVLTLPMETPVREGYTFLGWTDQADSKLGIYSPGSSFGKNGDTTFYAVWKDNSATAESLEITGMPEKTLYLAEEMLDTTGLELKLTYSDGSGRVTDQGYDITGFTQGQLGTQTISISCEGVTATYSVEVIRYIPGDMNLDRVVNRDDVMQLLWHISFPDRFPIEVPAEFTGDGVVDRDDVMRLLWHISFPDRFPLEPEETEQPEDPEQPTDPEEPEDPEQPTDPEEPEDPEQPTDPEEPEDPEQPTDPEEPEDPEQPTDPEEPEDPEQPTDPEESEEPEQSEDPESTV